MGPVFQILFSPESKFLGWGGWTFVFVEGLIGWGLKGMQLAKMRVCVYSYEQESVYIS